MSQTCNQARVGGISVPKKGDSEQTRDPLPAEPHFEEEEGGCEVAHGMRMAREARDDMERKRRLLQENPSLPRFAPGDDDSLLAHLASGAHENKDVHNVANNVDEEIEKRKKNQKCKMCDFTSSKQGGIIRHFVKVHGSAGRGKGEDDKTNSRRNGKRRKPPPTMRIPASEEWSTEEEEEETDITGEITEEDEEDPDYETEDDFENIAGKDSASATETASELTKVGSDAGREMRYKCEKCPHWSSRRSSLAQHVKRLHEDLEEEGSESEEDLEENLDLEEDLDLEAKDSSAKGFRDNVPPKRAPLAQYNRTQDFSGPTQSILRRTPTKAASSAVPGPTKVASFAIKIGVETLGFLDGVSPGPKL